MMYFYPWNMQTQKETVIFLINISDPEKPFDFFSCFFFHSFLQKAEEATDLIIFVSQDHRIFLGHCYHSRLQLQPIKEVL